MRRTLLGIIGLLALLSCSSEMQDGGTPLVKLGAGQKQYMVEVDGGVVNIPVYSNGAYHLEILSKDHEWLKLTMPSKLEENGYIRAECDFNSSFRRQVIFLLKSDVDSRSDTLLFRQKGLKEAKLSIDNRSIQAKGAGGEEKFVLDTNIPSDQIKKDIVYPGEEEWISGLCVSDSGELSFKTVPNQDEDVPRTAQIRLQFTDGWGEDMSLTLNVIQRTKTEKLGTVIGFDELKMDVVKSGKPIDEYVIIEGIVVSDRSSRNAGDNDQLTPSAIDYSLDQRTIYLESMDGTSGVCLITATTDDNQDTEQFERVQVLLYGAVPTLYEDPMYLVISNVTSSMFVSREKLKDGESPCPEKRLYMNQLTDSDIFTYVSLQDVEIPIRKGALMPVNEGYTVATNGHRLTKYPRLIRDINGDDMYMYVNTTCQFRNDGSVLPYGSGSISGVVVHEQFPRYQWRNQADPLDMDEDPTLGNIGKFQIRPQSRDDVFRNMNASVEDGFSKLLVEYRFVNPDEAKGVCLPTYGTNGWFTHTYQSKYTGTKDKEYTNEDYYHLHHDITISFDYLGPIGNKEKYLFGRHVGNENGIGIILDPSKEHWSPATASLVDRTGDKPQWCGPGAESPFCHMEKDVYPSINYTSSSMEGKGLVPTECLTAVEANHWWDYERNKPYSWLVKFSTAGISASQLSLQISTLNTSQTFYSPRYWKLEWSTTEDQNDNYWTPIAEYIVPDIGVWSNAMFHSITAYKQINFALPLQMLGKPNVYLRLSPANDLCSSGFDYADSHLNASETDVHCNAISYLAIRYN